MAYNPPGALSSAGWDLFEKEFKKVAPIRYFINDTARLYYVRYIRTPLGNIRRWILYRTVWKMHIVDTGLEPGYHERDEVMYYANFSILVDHVEISLAGQMNYAREKDGDVTWKEKYIPFYRYFVPFRSKEYGIKNLEWQATLDDPRLPANEQSPAQAVHAREILALYKWWTEERPARELPEIPDFDQQGLGRMAMFNPNFNKSAKDFQKYKKIVQHRDKLEKKWEKEDDAMLLRLIKLRRGLWT